MAGSVTNMRKALVRWDRVEPVKSGALCETQKLGPMALEIFDYSIIIISIRKSILHRDSIYQEAYLLNSRLHKIYLNKIIFVGFFEMKSLIISL